MLGVPLWLSWLAALASHAFAQPRPVDLASIPREERAPYVDVVTIGVGEEIFERWGHTAICLRYHQPEHAGVCFDYGVTEFDAGAGLAWSFLRGDQLFWVEPTDRAAELASYRAQDRDIWIQTLVLTDAQARAIEAGLRDSLHQRRRSYVYDHFHDNCTTRIRDLIDDAIGGALRAGSRGAHPLTYRELGKGGLAELPPLIAVADFLLGRALDERPTIWEAMFHPAVLRRQLELQLGVVSRVEHARTQAPFALEGPTGRVPLLVIALASTMVLLAASWRRRFEKPARIVATLYPGTWGLIVWALVALSPIAGLRWNEAALVVMPFDLAIPWLSSARAARYAQIRVAGVLAVAALCAAGVLLQPLWIPILTAILPLSTVAFGARLRRASDRQSAGGRPAGSAA